MFSLVYAWMNGWVNNGEAGDLRRHSAHYDVTVMVEFFFIPVSTFTSFNPRIQGDASSVELGQDRLF